MTYDNYKLIVVDQYGHYHIVPPGQYLGQGWEIAGVIIGALVAAFSVGNTVYQNVQARKAAEEAAKTAKKIRTLQAEISAVETKTSGVVSNIQELQEAQKKRARNILIGAGAAAAIGTLFFVL